LIIIGEKLNSFIPDTLEALNRRDKSFVLETARRQLAGCADYLDVNATLCDDETGTLKWVIETILANMRCRFMIDSSNPYVIDEIYDSVDIDSSVINSATLKGDHFNTIVSIALRCNAGIVAMPIDSDGIPRDCNSLVCKTSLLIDRLTECGVAHDRIFADVAVNSAIADWEAPLRAVNAVKALRKKYPGVHLLAGISNVSYGLPGRAVLNRAFLCFAMANGLDSAIMDPTDTELVMTAKAGNVINGSDEYCLEYIAAFRRLSSG